MASAGLAHWCRTAWSHRSCSSLRVRHPFLGPVRRITAVLRCNAASCYSLPSRGVFAPRPVGGAGIALVPAGCPAALLPDSPPLLEIRSSEVSGGCYSPVLAGVVTRTGEIFVLDPCRSARLRLPRSRRLGAAIPYVSNSGGLRPAFLKSPSVSLWKVAYAGSLRLPPRLHTDSALAHRQGCAGMKPWVV